jgi:hypothetical protein
MESTQIVSFDGENTVTPARGAFDASRTPFRLLADERDTWRILRAIGGEGATCDQARELVEAASIRDGRREDRGRKGPLAEVAPARRRRGRGHLPRAEPVASLAAGVFGECRLHVLGAEIGPQHFLEDELGIGRLPEQEVRDALLAGGADDEIRVRHAGGEEPGGEGVGIEPRGVERAGCGGAVKGRLLSNCRCR